MSGSLPTVEKPSNKPINPQINTIFFDEGDDFYG
jgi:hypothetical protein